MKYKLLTLAIVGTLVTPVSHAAETVRVSIASDGTEANQWAYAPSVSANGRYVVFETYADNLVAGDANGTSDIFVHDRETGETTRISVASDGSQSNGGSHSPRLSADGRYVVFSSTADNLVAKDTNGVADIFIHDRQTGKTVSASVASDSTQANDGSYNPSVSTDGRYVAFSSSADNLVTGDTNASGDIFVHDSKTGQTTRVSVTSNGAEANGTSQYPAISADGRYVAFSSYADTLVAGDSNGAQDIFVHDNQTGQTTRVSVASDGTQANGDIVDYPAISANGRYVAFSSSADNLVVGDTNVHADIFVHDTQYGETTRVSVASDGTEANDPSVYPSLSADGRFVSFSSYANNLVAGDSNGAGDVLVHDRKTGKTTFASVASDGTQAAGLSETSDISADGRFVAFMSYAANLVTGDTNGWGDVFVHDRLLKPNQRADLALTTPVAPTTATKGDIVNYSFTITNQGNRTAKNIALIDVLSDEGKLLTLAPSQGICKKSAVSVCRLGDLDAGKSLTVNAKMKAYRTGPFVQTVTVNSQLKDKVPTNNQKIINTKISRP